MQNKQTAFFNDIVSWPDKLTQGLGLIDQLSTKIFEQKPRYIAFIGMGGSGIVGRVIQELVEASSTIPVFVFNSPTLPKHLTPDGLAIVISYSGNTWESLHALEQLKERAIPTVIMSHGGAAEQDAIKNNFAYVRIPQAETPRGSLGFMLGFSLALVDKFGIFPGIACAHTFINHAIKQIPTYTKPEIYDDFLKICENIDFLHIWGITSYGAACAYRAQTQFNENSKVAAVHSCLPELNHNLLVGFTEQPKRTCVLLLAPTIHAKELNNTITATISVLKDHGTLLYKPTLFGDTLHVQLFDMILWADFASYHLGVQRGIDVAAVEIIDLLKQLISKTFKDSHEEKFPPNG